MGEEYLRQVLIMGLVPVLGPVVVYDDMEDLLKWTKGGTGGDDSLALDAALAYNDNKSLQLKTRATAGVEDDFVTATRSVIQRPGERYAVELLWRFDVTARLKGFSVEMVLYDGVEYHRCGVKYDMDNGIWMYSDGLTSWANIIGSDQAAAASAWHRLRFEFDKSRAKMITIVADGLEIDLTEYTYFSATSSTSSEAQLIIRVTAKTTTEPSVNIDDVMVLEV